MTGREWKPGDVAVATIQGERVRLMFNEDRGAGNWFAARWVRNGRGFDQAVWIPADIKDARPLVVIDPEDREQVERLAVEIYAASGRPAAPLSERLQIALREFANPVPPKPDEPQGLGAVVEDKDGNKWLRVGDTGTDDWRRTGFACGQREPGWKRYDEIAAVQVLSEGVSSND